MRQKAKKYLITTVTSEIYIVRTNKFQAIRGFCFDCQTEVEMFNLDAAVSVSGIAALEILRRIEADEIHFLETANGHLLLCRQSLGNFLNANAKSEGEIK